MVAERAFAVYVKTYELGRLPWLAPPFLRSLRLRERFDIAASNH